METMHLYQLSEKYQTLLAWLNSDEPIDEISLKLQLQNVTEQLKDKAENIGKMVLEYESDVTAIDNELARLSARKKSLTTKTDWLKSYLLQEMQTANIDKLPCDLLTISLRKSPPSVVVLNAEAVEDKFIRHIPATWEVDKRGILDNFKLSGEIPTGVEIVTDRKSLIIK
jgi:phage host-nuclease inhibitor protein Gam